MSIASEKEINALSRAALVLIRLALNRLAVSLILTGRAIVLSIAHQRLRHALIRPIALEISTEALETFFKKKKT